MENLSFVEILPWLKTTIYDGPIGITAKFYVKSEKVKKFRPIMENFVKSTKNLNGLRLYKLHADFNNPKIFWVTEEWDTVTDFKKYYVSEAYIKNAESLKDTVDEPVCQIAIYKPLN